MTAQPFRLDPEVEHVLQEVARDPNSSLLRIERPNDVRGLLESEPRVGVATAGLTLAERHLVQTRKAETALALRMLCLQTLQSDPRGATLLSMQGVIDATKAMRHLRAFASMWERDESISCEAGDEAALIEQHVLAERPSPISFLQVCAASQRLEPADSARSYAALWLLLEKQERSALNIMQRVFENVVTTFRTAAVGSNLGLGHHRLGNLEESLRWYAKSSEHMPSHVSSVVGRLVVAAQLGLRVDFLRAARLLDDNHSLNSPDVMWERNAESARRHEFQRCLSPEGKRMVLELSETLGPISRSFVDVLR